MKIIIQIWQEIRWQNFTSYRIDINFVSDYYRKLAISEKFKLISTSKDVLFSLLKNVVITKAVTIYQISGKFLKDMVQILVKPISALSNLFMLLRSFPDIFKIAKLRSLFKNGPKTDPWNYRAISILPLLSKDFEKIALDQRNDFLTLNKILCGY